MKNIFLQSLQAELRISKGTIANNLQVSFSFSMSSRWIDEVVQAEVAAPQCSLPLQLLSVSEDALQFCISDTEASGRPIIKATVKHLETSLNMYRGSTQLDLISMESMNVKKRLLQELPPQLTDGYSVLAEWVDMPHLRLQEVLTPPGVRRSSSEQHSEHCGLLRYLLHQPWIFNQHL